MGRAPCCDKANVKRGPWSPDEDMKLKEFIEKHGTGGNWIALPHKAGLKRCGKSCRLRWLNYLRPNIKHGEFSDAEDRIIYSLFSTIGSRWSIIAGHLPGRTDNDIKNYWNTKLKKKLLGIAPSQRMKSQSHRHLQEQPQLQRQQQPLQQAAFPSASFQLPSLEPTSSPPPLVQIPSAKSCMSTVLDAFQIGGLTSLVHGPSTSQQRYSQEAAGVFGSGGQYNSNPKIGHEHGGVAAADDGLFWQQASFESLLCNNGGLGENQKLLVSDMKGEEGESTAPWGEAAAPILDYYNANYEDMKQLMITSSATSGCTNLFFCDDAVPATMAGGDHRKSQEIAMYHHHSSLL